MHYSSKLIIEESAEDFNYFQIERYRDLRLRNQAEGKDSKLRQRTPFLMPISCDHSVSFKTVAASNDALFSCFIVTAKIAA